MQKMIWGVGIVCTFMIGVLLFTRTSVPQTKQSSSSEWVDVEQNIPALGESDSESPSVQLNNTAPLQSFTLAQVAQHNSSKSCYSIIRGSVYDLTAFAPGHPGGREEIVELCGRDGTKAFTGEHGGSAVQETFLETMRVGTLVP